jgi:hypothetical protein
MRFDDLSRTGILKLFEVDQPRGQRDLGAGHQ